MYLPQAKIVSFLKGKTFNSLYKLKEYPYLEWRGEIDDYFFIIRYSNETTVIGAADNELEALANLHLVTTGKINSILDLSKFLGFKLPRHYEEF